MKHKKRFKKICKRIWKRFKKQEYNIEEAMFLVNVDKKNEEQIEKEIVCRFEALIDFFD